MSFGKRATEQPRWLDEDELEQVLIEQGMSENGKSGSSMAAIAGFATLIFGAVAATLCLTGI